MATASREEIAQAAEALGKLFSGEVLGTVDNLLYQWQELVGEPDNLDERIVMARVRSFRRTLALIAPGIRRCKNPPCQRTSRRSSGLCDRCDREWRRSKELPSEETIVRTAQRAALRNLA